MIRHSVGRPGHETPDPMIEKDLQPIGIKMNKTIIFG